MRQNCTPKQRGHTYQFINTNKT